MNGIGIQARDDVEMISLKHCTITKCKEHALIACSGTKMAKIVDCYFESNCSPCTNAIASIKLKGCKVLIKNTSIKSKNYVGIDMEGGKGYFDTVIIENSKVGMLIQANVEVKNCSIKSCSTGIVIEKDLEGIVSLENNNINECVNEIVRTDATAMPTFVGEKKNAVLTAPSMYAKRGEYLKEKRKLRKMSCRDTNNSSDSDDFFGYNRKVCEFCANNESESKRFGKTLKVCNKCKMVYYCSSECQRKGWKVHKPTCEDYLKANLAAKLNRKS